MGALEDIKYRRCGRCEISRDLRELNMADLRQCEIWEV